MHDPIADFLAKRPIMVLDGALATELERRGADIRDPLWSAKCLIENPSLIRGVHLDYFLAGADVAITATYQASFAGFARRGLERAAATRLMSGAVTLAVEARDEFWGTAAHRAGRIRPLIAASIGPYGAALADGSEYRGNYPVDDQALADFHRPRLQVLAAAGADILACETIPCLREAVVLAELLREHPSICAWMSFSCRDGAHNAEGQPLAECAARLNGYAQIAAVGINCTPPELISPLLETLSGQTDKPLIVYPNSGEHYDAPTKQWHGEPSLPTFGEFARQWRRAGARLIGGCCRTGPSDIHAVMQCMQH